MWLQIRLAIPSDRGSATGRGCAGCQIRQSRQFRADMQPGHWPRGTVYGRAATRCPKLLQLTVRGLLRPGPGERGIAGVSPLA